MASLNGFNANNVKPEVGFEPIPAGDYVALIINSEMKANNAGTGEYLELQFEIVEGQFKGRKLFVRLNLNNPNDQAVGIARAELSAICRATGVMTPNDSVDLHNIPILIKVGMQKRKDTGDLENKIKGYTPRSGGVIPPVSQGTAASQQRAPWQIPVPKS